MAQVAADVSMSASQVHASLKRLERSRLLDGHNGRPIAAAVEEFFLHAVKYLFPAERGEVTRGVPTAHGAPPLDQRIAAGALVPVWPDPDGQVRGGAFAPLHKSIPHAARKDSVLYELLALIDAIRDGRARERKLAEKELGKRVRSLLHG